VRRLPLAVLSTALVSVLVVAGCSPDSPDPKPTRSGSAAPSASATQDGAVTSEVEHLGAPVQITVLNFSAEAIDGTVRSESLVPRSPVTDAETGENVGRVDDLQSFPLHLGPYEGRFLVLGEPEVEEFHPITRAMPIITGV
jgi:hypothetical protein